MFCSLSPFELIGGFGISVGIALLGYRHDALSGSGVVGAVVTGTLMCGLGGWEWGVLLVAFFVSSSVLSFYRACEKRGLVEKFDEGNRRDLGQALANSGIAALLAVLSQIWPHAIWFAACAGAIAAVNADTWATELGVLSSRPPRLITSGQQVEAGTSGGVTWLGMAASLGAALLIGLLGSLASLVLQAGGASAGKLLLAAGIGGLLGSICDSLLGASVQATYWCDECATETEQQMHRCRNGTRFRRGWPWLGNDQVNLIASLVGAFISAAVWWGLQ